MKNILRLNGILNGVTCVVLVCAAICLLAWDAVELSRGGELFGWVIVGEIFVAMFGGSFLLAWFALELTAFILTLRNWKCVNNLAAVKAFQVIAGAFVGDRTDITGNLCERICVITLSHGSTGSIVGGDMRRGLGNLYPGC